MSLVALCRRVTRFGFTLLEAEFALDARQHKIETLSATRESLTWTRDSSDTLMIGSPSRVDDYLSLLERQEYSYLMHDGGIIQISFVYEGNKINRHRLSYHPCPFRISRRDLEMFGGGLLDFIADGFMSNLEENVLLRSPVRFDYAPTAAADFHPASHITINDPNCRIPARSPLQFDTFIKFVLENFYLEAWHHPSVTRALAFSQEDECLSAHDRARAYLNWAHR
jgi:hypothetical protein